MSFYPNLKAYFEARRRYWMSRLRYPTNEENRIVCQKLLRSVLTNLEVEGGSVTREDWQLAGAAWAFTPIDLSRPKKRIEL